MSLAGATLSHVPTFFLGCELRPEKCALVESRCELRAAGRKVQYPAMAVAMHETRRSGLFHGEETR